MSITWGGVGSNSGIVLVRNESSRTFLEEESLKPVQWRCGSQFRLYRWNKSLETLMKLVIFFLNGAEKDELNLSAVKTDRLP